MKTRERILHAALALFNEAGEPNVTTNQIADELDISPGNLHYHFRRKSNLVEELFGMYSNQIHQLLVVPDREVLDMEDMWLFLHLLFEQIWRYRFIYRNVSDLQARYLKVKRGFPKVIGHKVQTALVILHRLSEDEQLHATEIEIAALANNLVLAGTFWLNFAHVAASGKESPDDLLSQGVFQVMSMVAPYLDHEARDQLMALGQQYLAKTPE